MKKTALSNALASAGAVALVMSLAGCGGGTLPDTVGSVRVVNATSEYDTLDVYSGTKAVSSAVPSYGVGAYAELDPGAYSLNLRNGNTTAAAATVSATVTKKEHRTLVAYTTGGSLTAAYLSDQETVPTKGNAKLRIFNTASTDAGAVDVYLIGSACSALVGTTAAALTTGVSGLQTAYTEVAATAGTPVRLCVTATGDKADVRLEIASFTLTDQQITTLILARSPGGVLLQGLLLDQQGALVKALNSSARVRVAASLSTVGNVSATVNGTVVATGLPSPVVGPYRLVPAGALTVSVNAITVPVAVATLAAGADTTLLVTGTSTAPNAFPIDDDNRVSTSGVRPVKIRLVNGLNGIAGPATLSVNNSPLGTGTAFGMASVVGTYPASAAATRIDVTFGGTTTNLGTTLTLGAGSVYTEFLLGSATANPPVTQLIADR